MSNGDVPTKQRLHITFGKSGALKYTSNLDVAKIWERVLRRADLPLLYTEGFNTRPRIRLASAIPLGITSECELLEVSLKEIIELDGMVERLQVVSPAGLTTYSVEEVPVNSPAPQNLVRSAEYRIRFEDGIDRETLQQHVDDLLAREEIIQISERKGKTRRKDLRPFVHDLTIDASGDLIAHLSTGEHGNLRPDILMSEMGLADEYHTVHRLRLHLLEED